MMATALADAPRLGPRPGRPSWSLRRRIVSTLAAALVITILTLFAQREAVTGSSSRAQVRQEAATTWSDSTKAPSSQRASTRSPQHRRHRKKHGKAHGQPLALRSSPPSFPPPQPPLLPSQHSSLADDRAINDVGIAQLASSTSPATLIEWVSDANASSWCTQVAKLHVVVPRRSWGSLPASAQLRWVADGCDHVVGRTRGASSRRRGRRHSAAGRASRPAVSVSRVGSGDGDGAEGADGAARGDDEIVGLGAAETGGGTAAVEVGGTEATTGAVQSAVEECTSMRDRHGVRPGVSWGSLPAAQQQRWQRLDCDKSDPTVEEKRRVEATYLAEYSTRLSEALLARPAERRIVRTDGGNSSQGGGSGRPGQPIQGRRTVMSICVCTTSRHTSATTLSDLALFSIMLPSLHQSLEGGGRASPGRTGSLRRHRASRAAGAASDGRGSGGGGSDGGGGMLGSRWRSWVGSLAGGDGDSGSSDAAGRVFEFWLYVLYDAGDPFYDNSSREAEVREWLGENMVRPLGALGVTLRFALLRFDNVLRKPGPAFNFMMAAAAQDGADYLYRVNDDTQFVGKGWAAAAVRVLRGYSPPDVGVVGPRCDEGNTRILTHDLVHRTHLDIFEHYYPPVFSDWWMDDWITKVYGTSRTHRATFRVRHHTGYQGTRYEVDQSHEARLQSELQVGRQRIERWLQRQRGGRGRVPME